MWSVWSEPINLYLGQGLVLLGRAGERPLLVEFPRTLPLHAALQRVGEAGGALLSPGTTLRVRLSGALCPAMTFDIPRGISGWRELEEVARASISAQMNLPPTDILMHIDALHPGLAAALARPFLEQIHSWAAERTIAIRSISPLWTEGAGCARARQRRIGAIVLSEPDAVTVLAETPEGVVAQTASQTDEGIKALNEVLAAGGVNEEGSVKLRFSAVPGEPALGSPQFMAANWSAHEAGSH